MSRFHAPFLALLVLFVGPLLQREASAQTPPASDALSSPPPPPPISRPRRPQSPPLPQPSPADEPAPSAPARVPPAVPLALEPTSELLPKPLLGPEPDSFEEPTPTPPAVEESSQAPQPQTPPKTIVVPPSVGTAEEMPEPAAAAPPEPYKFIKGDLTYPGTRRLLSRYDHVGVALGANIIDNALYMPVSPGMAWYFDFGLAVSAHVPLNLKMIEVNGTNFEFGELRIRREDWDEVSDFAKVIRFVTYGRKEEQIYATINTMRPMTLGHGMVINRYQGDIDVDRSLTSLIFDAYNQYAGVQLKTNDITFQNLVVGGLGFIKPLSLFSDNIYAQSLSLGGEYVADFRAPRCILINQGAQPDLCVQGSGHFAGRPAYGGPSADRTFVRSDENSGRVRVQETTVHAVGGSAEFKFYKDARNIDLKAYSTFHHYLNPGGGWGLAAGVLARLNVGDTWRHAFRIRGEYRTFTDGFLPNYFDTLYEIQKYAYLYRSRDHQAVSTKYQYVFGDPDNGYQRVDRGQRHGYNADIHWALFEGSRSQKRLAIGIGLQDAYAERNDAEDDLHFYAHIEADLWSWVQIFGTYMRTNVRGFDTMFNTMLSQNAMLLAGVRIKILPVLFINAHYSRSFRITRSPGSEYHLGNDTIVDFSGQPTPFLEQDHLHDNVQTLFVEVEFGWEFDDDDSEGEEGDDA